MNEPEKLNGESLDVAAAKRAELKQLFPAAFTETVNENGKLTASVDFERLKAELGEFTDLFERRRERYGMEWPGKSDCLKVIQEQSRATLKPCRKESVNFDTTENLFIEGDNLEVLKLLQKSYHGQVKMIYIDPPYNTGNEFIYPDNFTESLDTYLDYAGLTDEQGRRIESKKNSRDEGRFHTKWLNMMYPRLTLARNLLRDDGVIFISIDDNEVSNLRKLCDEVFGEENFLAEIMWKKRSTPPNDKIIGAQHEYIMVYSKSAQVELNLRERTQEQIARYKNPDNHPKGPWTAGDLMANVKGGRYVKSLYYPIINPNTGEEHYPSSNGNWRFNKEKIQALIANDEIYFGENGNGRPKLKRFLSDIKTGITWTTIWDFVPLNTAGSSEMTQFFGNMVTFENPKPSGLIKNILQAGSKTDDIILDFFAGSATTAHAVLDLNKEDGGNRKFIMVQLPEPCDEKSEAAKAGYKTIADIGKERIRRVIQKITTENTEQTEKEKADNPLFNQDSVSSVSSVVQKQDLGFRVLKLDKSNFKAWQPLPADASEEEIKKALQGHLFHVDETSSQEEILFEILLKAGFMPSTEIETLKLAGKTVYSVAEGMLFICLEDEITRELIDAVVEKLPQQFICLDRGFKGNDQLKANTVQTFSALNESKDKDTKIIFRTV